MLKASIVEMRYDPEDRIELVLILHRPVAPYCPEEPCYLHDPLTDHEKKIMADYEKELQAFNVKKACYDAEVREQQMIHLGPVNAFQDEGSP